MIKEVNQNELKVGDIIVPWFEKQARITGFREYRGTLSQYIDRIAELAPYPDRDTGFIGKGMSLEQNGYIRLVIKD